ncbi:MAG: hypothetical protein ACRD1F_11045, partial [Terriglobales bacterium]
DARAALAKAVRASSSAAPAAQPEIDHLSSIINSLVDLHIQSGEGSLVYPDYLRSWLFRINSRIESGFVAPTQGMIGVATMYIQQADAGAAKLHAALASARKIAAN